VLIPLFEWDVEEGWESEENREYTWDTVPPSSQREQDVELVRAMLERSGWRAGTAAVGDMAIQPFAAGGIPDKLFEPGLFSGKGDTDGISVITSKELFAVKDSVAVEAALRKFAEETAESAIEKAVVISPDGHKYEIDGRSYVVGIHVVGEEALEGAEVIHNHPGSGADSFSEADFVGFFAYKLKSLEVVYNGKRHRMEWDGERLTEDKAKEVYDRAWQYLEQLAADSRVRMQDDAQYGVMSYLKENLKGLLFYEL
jgi:hypothetical protein